MLMTHPVRKFAGTVALLALIVAYIMVVTAFAASSLLSSGVLVQTLFYIAAGLGWVPPAMLIVSWMYHRESKPPAAP